MMMMMMIYFNTCLVRQNTSCATNPKSEEVFYLFFLWSSSDFNFSIVSSII